MVISNYAIRKKTTVFVLMFIFAVTGAYSYLTIPREAAPDIEIPYIIVTTPYSGASPSDIESTVTIPLERELKGLSHVKVMKSTSAEGASMIMIEFETTVDMEEALRKVKAGVDRAKGDLPREAEDPAVLELNISEFPIMIINISGEIAGDRTKNLVALKTLAEKLKDVIVGLPGILDAKIVGGLTPEVRIEIDPDKLAAYRVPAAMLVAKYMGEDVDISAGNTRLGNLKYDIRVPMEFERDVGAAKNIIIQNLGSRAIRLGDVAEIVPSFEEESSFSRLNKKESVSILVQKQSGKNILIIAAMMDMVLKEAKKSGRIPDEISMDVTNEHAVYIRMMVSDLENNILTGLILVVLVLFVFLGLRNSFFVALAIPFSLLISMTILAIAGITMNMIVLFSLILSLGMLVDNAIVIVENIYRHRQEGFGSVEAAMKGTAEVAWPIITSTATTVCAFSPIVFWPGIMGEFMWFLPLTVIITLSSSLFVALIITPTLCAYFMNIKPESVHAEGERPIGRFMSSYRTLLRTAVTYRKSFAIGSFLVLVGVISLYRAFGKGTEFFPSSDPKHVYVDIRLPEGTTLKRTDKIVAEIEDIIERIDAEDKHKDIKVMVSSVGTQGGGLLFSSSAAGVTPHLATISLEFIDLEDRRQKSTEVIKNIREQVSHFAGVELKVKKEQEGPPTGAPINIEFYGEEYDVLAGYAYRVKDIVRNIPGAVDIKDDMERGRPELRVEVDRTRAALLGLTSREVGTTIKTAYRGAKVGVFRIGDEEYDINVIASKKYREGFGLLDKLYISTRTGAQVPASSVAKWNIVGAPGVVRRIGQKRTVTVSGDIGEGHLAPEVRKKVIAAMEEEFGDSFPEGYGYRITGEQEAEEEASAFLMKAFVIAIMLVALVLISQFNSVLLPLIILMSVALSLIGVFLGLIIVGYPFGIIMTGVGVISLVGVVVNNAIVLIDYIQKLRSRGLRVVEALVQAGMIRLRPVLLTAVTTILGLLPMAAMVSFNFREGRFNIGTEMAQWWGSMAVAVIFGLAFATLLTLVMVPTFFFITHNASHFLRTKVRRKGLTEEAFSAYLANAGVLDSDAAEQALKAARASNKPYQDLLASEEYLGPKVLLAQLSDFTGYPVWADLSRVGISVEFRDFVSRELAGKYGAAGFRSLARMTLFGPVGEPDEVHEPDAAEGFAYLAISDPLDPNLEDNLSELARMLGEKLIPILSTREQVEALIERTYSGSKNL